MTRQDTIRDTISKIHAQAALIGGCGAFTGRESLPELAELFLSDGGLDFCLGNRFPNTSTFRLFRGCGLEKHGIYIDSGDITLQNPGRAVLIGRTAAVVKCDTLERQEVVALNGAKAVISASGWSVVAVRAQSGCTVVRNASENAIIL